LVQQIPEDRYKVKLYKSTTIKRIFIDCVKSRQPTITRWKRASFRNSRPSVAYLDAGKAKIEMGCEGGEDHWRRRGEQIDVAPLSFAWKPA